MTSNDASSPGPRAGRRRALGRGPGETQGPATASEEEAPPRAAPAPVAVEPPPEAAPAGVPPEGVPAEALLPAVTAPAEASRPHGPEIEPSPFMAPDEADAAEAQPEPLPQA
ncbi:hypothetical protein GTW93_13315, partial [Streptomyces sp. SID5789]|nr:hypothetical protein [Streptomyces sp. SID5789]